MRSFENRLALAEVLDTVHRQTIAEALGGLGVHVAHAHWNEIKDVASEQKSSLPEGTFLSRVEYFGRGPLHFGGVTSVGTLFGEEYMLTRSGRTPTFDHIPSSVGLGEDKYRRRIELFSEEKSDRYPDFTSIYLLPDVPPIAVHVDAIIDLHRSLWERGEIMPDTQIIEGAQKKFGSEGVEYISEEMAKRVMYALLNDQRRLFNIDLFDSGG